MGNCFCSVTSITAGRLFKVITLGRDRTSAEPFAIRASSETESNCDTLAAPIPFSKAVLKSLLAPAVLGEEASNFPTSNV